MALNDYNHILKKKRTGMSLANLVFAKPITNINDLRLKNELIMFVATELSRSFSLSLNAVRDLSRFEISFVCEHFQCFKNFRLC